MNAGRNICSFTGRFRRRWWSAVAAALVVCAAAPPAAGRRGREVFDPLGFPGDDAVITADVQAPRSAAHVPQSTAEVSRADSALAPAVILQVQFFATTDLVEARDMKRRAEAELKDSVNLDFETPYYKLRAGRFSDYDRAEALAVRLRAMGFESAWVVRRAQVAPRLPRKR